MASSCRGLMSHITTSASGSAVTREPVRISPPSARRYAARASLRRCAPPRGNGQPTGVRGDPHHQPHGRAGRPVERHDGVRGQAGEQGAGALAAKQVARQAGGRADRVQSETRHQHGVVRQAERRQHVVAEARPGGGEGLHQLLPGGAVRAEIGGGGGQRALHHHRRAVVQRMSQRRIRLHPFQTVPGQRELLETRRAGGHRLNAGADVVNEAGEGEFGRARAAADPVGGLVHRHRAARARQQDGGGQTVRAGAHHHRPLLPLLRQSRIL